MTKRRKALPTALATATVNNLSHDGRGIAHINGKTTFIFGALPGEEVTIKYEQVKGRYDEARCVNVNTPVPTRVENKCPHFGTCGGCSLQHMAPSQQITLKQSVLLEQLQHYAGIQPKEILPPITGPSWGYRRKARLGARYVDKKGKLLIGFRERRSRFLADLNQCPVLHPRIGTLIQPLKELIQSLDNFRDIPQIEVAMGDDDLALVVRHLSEFSEKDLAQIRQFSQDFKVCLYLQPRGIDSIHKLWPKDEKFWLTYRLPQHNLELRFHPCDFTQVNHDINQAMLKQALDLLKPQAHETILDLFCGLGNFTLPIAKLCAKVVGVEGEGVMVERAKQNAALNQLTNAEFHLADLSQDFSHYPWAQQHYDKVLLDPPRSGAITIIQHLAKLGVKHIVYVSCNPATLARDAGELINNQGFTLTACGVMDMFPHTAHVESIAVFQR